MNTDVPTGRILIRGARILTQDPKLGELTGDILIDAGVIAEIGASLDDQGASVVEGTDRAVMPGFVDTHRHTWQGAVRQTGIGWDFPSYRQHIQLTWGPEYTPEDVYWRQPPRRAERPRRGHHHPARRIPHPEQPRPHRPGRSSPERLRHPCRPSHTDGRPSTPTPGCSAAKQPTPKTSAASAADLLPDDDALVTLQAMLRGPELSTTEVSAKDLALARELGIRSSMHVGNGAWGPMFRGIGSLGDAGLLGDDLLFIHCCTSDDDELRMLADSGATASVAAAIEAVMPGLGVPATGRLLKFGIRPSLSVDTEATVAGDMFNVMRAAIAAHGVGISLQPEVYEELPSFTPADLLEFATVQGARATGLDERTGSLTVGKAADLIVIKLDELTTLPATDAAASIVGAGNPAMVETVLVAGIVKKWRGKLTHPDLDKVRASVEESRDRLLATPLVEG